MRIGVDAVCWANGRGYGRFTRELLPAMADAAPQDEFVCFLDRRAADAFTLTQPNVRPVVVDLDDSPTEAAAADDHRSVKDMLRLGRAVSAHGLEAFFFPSVYSYFPVSPRLPLVVTIHDAIADVYPELTVPSRRARVFWRLKVTAAVWQSRLVLTVSDFAADQIASALGIRRSRIRVAVEAPATSYRPSRPDDVAAEARRLGLPPGARWFTYVGGFNPHKNVETIVRAHAALRDTMVDPPYLLLVGATDGDVFHGDRADICRAIEEAKTTHLVKWTGFVPDEALAHLHSGAAGLLLPSVCEGFGLPAVEAAACGTPVIATTASPLPQLLSGGGLFVPPSDQQALVHAMRHFLENEPERSRMGVRARERASELSWARAAASAMSALREAAA